MNELIREIEEDLRNERIQKLWRSFGKIAVGASIAVVLATVVTVLWKDRAQTEAMLKTSELIKGLDRMNMEDYAGAGAVFSQIAEHTDSSYRSLAMLRKAEVEMQGGDKVGALASYQALAHRQAGGDKALIGLAELQAAQALDADITVAQDSPFYYAQSEWRAWQVLQKGDRKEAYRQFSALRDDPRVPASMRERLSRVVDYVQ